MKDIGILNLTRFGDLIQTSPVLSGLRKRNPDARIHLIVKSRFRAAAELLPSVDVIHEIDGDDLARTLSDPDISFLSAYRTVRSMIQSLANTHFDALYNFTHSCSSAVLLDLLSPDRAIGFSIDRDGHRSVTDPWLAHLATVVRARRLMRINLVDTYLGAAGLAGCGEQLAVHVPNTAREFAASRLPPGVPLLGVQLGASQDTKIWPVERFGAVLRAISERAPALRFVLVGVKGEAEAAATLEAACPRSRFENLVGQTSIEELAAVLERCALLLTADTGTMHLAAAVGTLTCAVFVGLGHPYETGAYAEGHWALRSRIPCAPCSHLVQCGHPVCHGDFPAEWIAELIDRIVHGNAPESTAPLPRAEVLRTRFDDNGLLELVPVHVRPADAEDLMALAYQAIFFESFSGTPARPESTWRRAQRFHAVVPGDWLAVLPEELPACIEELRALAQRGERLTLDLERHTVGAQALRQTGELLRQTDEAIYRLARTQPLLAPLAVSLESGLESLPDQELAGVAALGATHYRALQQRAALLDRLVRGPDQGGHP
jgi:ADP-heptose:LPS heptosyltransferase